MEQQHTQRDALLATLVDAVDDAIVVTSLDDVVHTWSRGAERVFGYAPSEMIGKPASVLLHAERRAESDDVLRRVRNGERVEGLHTVRVRKNGRPVAVSMTISPLVDVTGHVLGACSIAREAASSVELLRASEARLAGIISIAADAIIVLDEQLRITLFNRAAEELFGWTAAEILGRPLDTLIPERFHGRHHQHTERFASEPLYARRMASRYVAVSGVRRDGEEFPAEVAISRVTIGNDTSFTAVVRDVTDERRTERTHRLLADAGPALAESIDYDETLAAIAQIATRELADFCVVDVIEENGAVRRVVVAHRDPRAADVAFRVEATPIERNQSRLVARVLETGQATLLCDVTDEQLKAIAQNDEHLAALRALRPRSSIAVPLIARGVCRGAIALVSSSRRYDDADLELSRELARRAALAVDNAIQHRRARLALRARDEVLGTVAHDLRNPINVIRLSAELLASEVSRSGGTTGSTAIHRILRASARAGRLVRDLIDAQQLDGGHLGLSRTHERPIDLLREGAALTAAIAEHSSISVELRADEGLPTVVADRDRVLQVLENLLGNAMKFSARGASVLARAELHGEEVVFSITDTGPGIAHDDLLFVFESFWKGSPSDPRGAGLGLAIAKGIVEAHGGRIGVESTLGAGSTFWFTLPTT